MSTAALLQLRLTRPDGTVLAWLTVPDDVIVDNWGPTPEGNFWVGSEIGPAAVRPPWRFEQRTLPDGEWFTLAENVPDTPAPDEP